MATFSSAKVEAQTEFVSCLKLLTWLSRKLEVLFTKSVVPGSAGTSILDPLNPPSVGA